MGRDTSSVTYTHAERTRYRITMRENLETFARYLPKAEFAPAGSIGMEMEMNLIDADGRPVRRATDTLAAIGSQDFTTELGAHNLELNLPAFPVKGDNLDRVEQALRARLALAQERAGQSASGCCRSGSCRPSPPRTCATPTGATRRTAT
ncbi:MAG: hypothetical protein L0K84_10075, partial [Acidipropionibacterium jensenii]|nr:hypothetical protein [Acidipropionibacterium jensenii]